MAIKLIVNTPFNDYQKGDEITDAAIVLSILDGDQSGCVIKVSCETVAPTVFVAPVSNLAPDAPPPLPAVDLHVE